MTYPASTIAYWVGQANDTSGGAHPPGWSSGQRWSETASEWSAAALDTSTGAHPPGWTNGQYWSETATEWMNDRNAVYNSRYTEGYNNGYAAGDAAVKAALGSSPGVTAAALSGSGLGAGWGNRGGLSVPKAGYYLIYMKVRLSVGDHLNIRIYENNSTVRADQGYAGGSVAGGVRETSYGPALVSAGTSFQGYTDHINGFDTIDSAQSYIRAVFIPTQSYI